MTAINSLNPEKIPYHVAIIMDGNGRWAQKRKMFRTIGHKVGVESVQNIVEASRKLGIKALTLYAFSTENWQRPKVEVKTLMTLLKTFLAKELSNLKENNIKLISIGQREKMPEDVQQILNSTIKQTATNTGMVLNLALSYGSRDEITQAVKRIAEQCCNGKLIAEHISEQTISDNLQTSNLPDPDLIIRTGGESRLSNFLLWQAAYSEIYITDTHWPDFREDDLIVALENYSNKQRRFGKTGDQIQQQEFTVESS